MTSDMCFDPATLELPYWEDYRPYGAEIVRKPQTEDSPTRALAVVPPLPQESSELYKEAPAVLMIDIECSPSLSYVYDVWHFNASPDMLHETSEVLCFAYKWLGGKDVAFMSKYHHGKQRMIKKAWALLDEADIVMTYYGKKYDVPKLNTEFAKNKFNPPSPFKQIDLYDTVSKQFAFTYKGLDFVSKQLGLQGKTDKIPFPVWLAAMKDDQAAWAKVVEYNKGDVQALESLYYRLRPWIKGHPSFAVYTGRHVCPNCGSAKLQRRGYAYTAVSVFQRWQCQDCGSWSRTTRSDNRIRIRQTAD